MKKISAFILFVFVACVGYSQNQAVPALSQDANTSPLQVANPSLDNSKNRHYAEPGTPGIAPQIMSTDADLRLKNPASREESIKSPDISKAADGKMIIQSDEKVIPKANTKADLTAPKR
jgi:hypothetical protein